MLELQAGEISKVATLILMGQLGTVSIAAIGMTHQILFFGHMLIMGLTVGALAMGSQAYGASDSRLGVRAALLGWQLAAGTGLLLGLGVALGAAPAMRLLGAAPDVVEAGLWYARWSGLSLGLLGSYTAQAAAIRAEGDSFTPFRLHLVGQGVHLVALFILVLGWGPIPAFGTAGAGTAAFMGHLVTAMMIHRAWLRRIVGPDSASLREWLIPPTELVRRQLSVSLPAVTERLVMALGQLAFIRVVAALGTQAFAAHQILLSVNNTVWTLTHGFVVAATVTTGHYLGAGQPDRAVQTTRMSTLIAAGLVTGVSLLLIVFARSIGSFYTTEADVLQIVVVAMPMILLFQLPQAICACISGALHGAGDTRYTLIVTLVGIWAVRNPILFVIAHWLNWGLIGAWAMMALDFWVRGLLVYLRFRGGRWRAMRA